MYRTLQIDILEARALPSLAAGAIPIAHPQVQPAATPSHVIDGHASGTYSTSVPSSNTGSVYTFSGTGKVGGLGKVDVEGSVTCVGASMRGQAQGVFTISSSLGSFMIEVTGPQQHFFAPLPQHFQYRILQSNGAVQGFTGDGTLSISLVGPAHERFQMTIH